MYIIHNVLKWKGVDGIVVNASGKVWGQYLESGSLFGICSPSSHTDVSSTKKRIIFASENVIIFIRMYVLFIAKSLKYMGLGLKY